MVRRRCSSWLVTHSTPVERNRFERTSPILPSGARRDAGHRDTAPAGPARAGPPGMSQERLRRILSRFSKSFLKSPFCLIFLLWSKRMSRVTKIERDKKNGFISFFAGCLLGSFDITLRRGCLVSVFPLRGHSGSFLLFFVWVYFS